MRFTNYQRGGIYTRVHPRIVPAITEAARAVGVPDVAMSCHQPKGVGLHKTGEACDFQAGNVQKYGDRYRDAYEVHTQIAKYFLKHWDRLKVRYMAWDGTEWGGSDADKNRKRAQKWEPWHRTASDPWHRVHVHVDFRPGAIDADPTIPIGAAFTTPTPTKPPIVLEDDMKLVESNGRVYATNGLTRRYINNPAELSELQKLWGKVHKVPEAVVNAIPDHTAMLAGIAEDAQKAKAEVGRSAGRERDLIEVGQVLVDATGLIVSEVHDSDSKKSLRERMEQTNAAVGRAEKARIAAEKKEQN